MTSRTEAEGTTYFTFGTSAGSHNIGRLTSVSMTGYSEALSYDSIGRPSTRTITTDQAYDIDYAYNNQGQIDTLTYPTSTSSTRVKIKYGYAYGILNTVTTGPVALPAQCTGLPMRRTLAARRRKKHWGNGVVTTRNFDAVTGWLNSIQSGPSGSLQNHSYLYDLLGNVIQRQENTLGLTEGFYYDNLYRLEHSTLNSGGGAATNLTLTYNAMGNITSHSDVIGTGGWTYDGSKKHAVTSTGTGGFSYSYDANGNMNEPRR